MYLLPISTDPLQTQNFTHEGYDLTLTTRWNSVVGFWNIDLFDNTEQVYLTQAEPLTVGSAACIHLQLPFVFVMLDESNLGTGPIDIDEMGDRINVYLLDKEEYHAAIRASGSISYRE